MLTLPLGLAGLFLVLGGRLVGNAQRAAPRPTAMRTTVWDFPRGPSGPMRAVAMVPEWARPGERFPLLVTFHGWGESVRGVQRGAFGWPRDYELGASAYALRRVPFERAGFLGHVDERRFQHLRRDLARRPFQGVVVVAPYTPDILGNDAGALQADYARWVIETLIPRARRELPVVATREATGVDGVSLGGLHALLLGFDHPEVFGAVGALQPAVHERVAMVASRYVSSPTRPAQRVRLVTSRGDIFLGDVNALHAALDARGVVHERRVLAGPHDYVFNRGPGGIEMLLFHDRALRGLSAE